METETVVVSTRNCFLSSCELIWISFRFISLLEVPKNHPLLPPLITRVSVIIIK